MLALLGLFARINVPTLIVVLLHLAFSFLLEPGISQFAASHLDRSAMFLLPCSHVKVFDRERDVQTFTQCPHEALVAHRLLSTQVEIAMCSTAFDTGLQQHMQQGHRVGSAAQCHQHGMAICLTAFLAS